MKEMLKISGISYEINSVPLLNRSARAFSKVTSSALSVKRRRQIVIAAIDLQSKAPSQGQIQMMQDVNIYMVEQETEAYDSGIRSLRRQPC